MILVTGAAGTVGREVVRALAARGAQFKVGVRGRPVPGAATVPIDFDKPETLAPALRGITALFLLSNTVAPEAGVVKAAKAAGVARVVKLSVWGAAGERFTFGKWHRAVERELEASGLEWTFLRPNGFMQNIVNYTGATIRSQNAIYHAAGDGKVSHVHAADIGDVAAEVLTGRGHAGKAYELSGPQAIGYGEIAQILSRVLGRKIQYVSLRDEDYKQGAVAAGMPPFYADALVDLARSYRAGDFSRVSGDVKAVTGREPIPFEQFARESAAALAPA